MPKTKLDQVTEAMTKAGIPILVVSETKPELWFETPYAGAVLRAYLREELKSVSKMDPDEGNGGLLHVASAEAHDGDFAGTVAEVNLTLELVHDALQTDASWEPTKIIADRMALDLWELAYLGDKTSGDAYLALLNGYKQQGVTEAEAAKQALLLLGTGTKVLWKYRPEPRLIQTFVWQPLRLGALVEVSEDA